MLNADTKSQPGVATGGTRSRVREVVRDLPVLQVAALVALFIVTAATIPGFVTKSSLYSVLILAAFLGLAALGQTIVILLGGIDLSVPAIISGVNLIFPTLIGKGLPPLVAILVVLVAAMVIGAASGFLVKRLDLPPLMITIAVGAVVAGVSLRLSDNGVLTGNLPSWLTNFAAPIAHTFGVDVPPVLVLWLALALIVGIVLRRTVTGRHVYATGTNVKAASIAGIRTTRVWVGAYMLSAASAAVVGILLDGFVGAPTTAVGDPYLFTSLTAVVVGGTALTGGRGDYWRTVLGALIVTLASTFLVGHGAGQAPQEIIFGLLILVFVGIYGRDRRVRDRV